MTDELQGAIRDAEKAASGSGPARLIEMLASKIGSAATTTAVFGEPIVRSGVTVIPVAKVRWAFGGGAGSGVQPNTAAGEGGGGGGGVTASPIGFIEVRDNEAVFHRIPPPPVAVILAGAVVVLVSLRGIRRILRG